MLILQSLITIKTINSVIYLLINITSVVLYHFFKVQPYQPGAMVSVVPRPPLLPREFQPNDYLVVTLVITIGCAVFNLTSLFFSIPAIICSALVRKCNVLSL